MSDVFCIIDGDSYVRESIAKSIISEWTVYAFIVLTVLYYCVWIYPRWKKKLRDVPVCSRVCDEGEEEIKLLMDYVRNVANLATYVFVSEAETGSIKKKLKCMVKEELTIARIRCLLWVMHRVGFGVVIYRLNKSDKADEYLRSEGVKDIITL